MDPFLITKFQDIAEGRKAVDKLKRLGVSAILGDTKELYVSAEHVDRAIEAIGLPNEVRNARQPGPWCPHCGKQLVPRRMNKRFFIPTVSGHCHNCDDEVIKGASTIQWLRRQIKRSLVKMGYQSKPAFIIIGAQKAGTTAMFRILNQHPQIVAPGKKELHFFDSMGIRYGDFVTYHEMLPLPYRLKPDKLTFEASPSYLYDPECPERIYRYSPGIRLIAILREPIARAFSAWNMYRSFTHSRNPSLRSFADHRSFEEAVMQEVADLEETEWKTNQISYIKRGIYIEQLEKYLQYFSRDSLLILEHSHLMRDPQSVLAGVFRFLEIDDRFEVKTLRSNVTKYDNEIPIKTREVLESVFKPYNQRLFQLLEKEYDW